MIKKGYLIILIILVLVCSLFGTVFFFNGIYTNKDMYAVEDSLVTKQSKLEEDFIVDGYSIDNPNIIVNPYGISPLTALILFETKKEVPVKVTVCGKDKYSTFSKSYKKRNKHYVEVLGLYPGKENKVIVEVDGIEHEVFIKTESLPKGFILPIKVKADKEKLDNSLYFFTPAARGNMCAYDVNGDVRWYLNSNFTWDNKRLKNGHMMISTNRLVNPPYYTSGLYEIDMLGKIYNEYSLPGGYHHDYFEMESGNLLVASNDFNSNMGTVEDVIVELDRKTGKIVKTFDVKDYLNMEDGKSENWSEYDWFHNNSVWYDEKTNSITLSGRHKDAVINIGYDSNELNWIIGDSTKWDKEFKHYFFKPVGKDFEWQWSQHAAMITPEGYVFVLDNGNNKSKNKKEYVPADESYTRGVMYKIDTKKMKIEQVYEYGKERGSKFYSPYISDVDYLDKNHYIVHSGGIVYKDGKVQNQPAGLVKGGADKLVSDTVELIDDEVVFEIVLPTNNYRVEKLSLYNESELKLGMGKRLGTLGKTKAKDTRFTIKPKVYEKDKEYKNREIKFINEEDRLTLSGKFKRSDEVEVLLYKNLLVKEYDVKVSKKPYTAMCVDVFTEEENKNGIRVNKYINKAGLNGKYSVYLKINDKLYNTGKCVNFNE